MNHPKAKHFNLNKDGVHVSTDWGIVQICDAYWIGPGKRFPSGGYVLDNPEECVRWMIESVKAGHINWWVCAKIGLSEHFSA